jgi:hypothetical protein
MVGFAGLGLGFACINPGATPPALILLSVVGATASLAWFLSLQPRVPRPWVQALLTATLLIDLGAIGQSLIELRSTDEVLREGQESAAWAAAQPAPVPGPYRVYSPSHSIPQHTGAQLGLERLDGVDPIQLRWSAEYVGLAGGCPATGYGVTLPHIPHGADPSTACRDAVPDARLLGLLNVCFVVAEYPIHAPGLALEGQIAGAYRYRNEHCMPRAFLMTRVEMVRGWRKAQDRLAAGHDPTQSALVDHSQTKDGHPLDGPPGWQPATIRDRSPNHMVLDVETTQESLLVLGEVWYPGWQVTVDRVIQPVRWVNGTQRGVYLDPGAHTVEWRYRPATLRWGAGITLCSLAAWLLSAGLAALPRRRSAAQ